MRPCSYSVSALVVLGGPIFMTTWLVTLTRGSNVISTGAVRHALAVAPQNTDATQRQMW